MSVPHLFLEDLCFLRRDLELEQPQGRSSLGSQCWREGPASFPPKGSRQSRVRGNTDVCTHATCNPDEGLPSIASTQDLERLLTHCLSRVMFSLS